MIYYLRFMEADKYPGEYMEGPSPIQLIEELKYRGQYYIKGFLDLGNHVRSSMSIFERRPNTRKELGPEIIKSFDKFTSFYFAIPFEKLKKENHPDYNIFCSIASHIPILAEELEKFMAGKTNREKYNENYIEMCSKGGDFKEELNKLIKKIRSYPGYENFKLKITDHKGRLWGDISPDKINNYLKNIEKENKNKESLSSKDC